MGLKFMQKSISWRIFGNWVKTEKKVILMIEETNRDFFFIKKNNNRRLNEKERDKEKFLDH